MESMEDVDIYINKVYLVLKQGGFWLKERVYNALYLVVVGDLLTLALC